MAKIIRNFILILLGLIVYTLWLFRAIDFETAVIGLLGIVFGQNINNHD